MEIQGGSESERWNSGGGEGGAKYVGVEVEVVTSLFWIKEGL